MGPLHNRRNRFPSGYGDSRFGSFPAARHPATSIPETPEYQTEDRRRETTARGAPGRGRQHHPGRSRSRNFVDRRSSPASPSAATCASRATTGRSSTLCRAGADSKAGSRRPTSFSWNPPTLTSLTRLPYLLNVPVETESASRSLDGGRTRAGASGEVQSARSSEVRRDNRGAGEGGLPAARPARTMCRASRGEGPPHHL